MNVDKINKLEDVLPLEEGSTIIDHKIERLTAAGENYGSLMLSVDITVKTSKGNKEIIHAVAKMVPPNEFIQKVFNTQVTFRNEIGFYTNIVPTLRDFQREQGIENVIDFFPECYGGRINLTGDSTKVDSDAVLLLENLKMANYKNIERTEGFDLEAAKLIIIDMAHLHAVPIGLKLKKPEVFEKEVKTYLQSNKIESKEEFTNKLLRLVESIDECKPYFERAEVVVRKEPTWEVREPFATISHNDMWVNNTMVKIEEGKPVKNKLVDFQICDYGSPAKDLIFFIFSSLRNDVLEEYCDYLIKLYHNKFIGVLEQLGCSTDAFSFENFYKEIEHEAHMQFGHTIFMFFPIFAPKGSVAEISDMKEEDILNLNEVTDAHKKKLALVIKEFAKRNWI